MTESNSVKDVTFVLAKAHEEVGNWFRDQIGAEPHYRYESVPRNYLLAHAEKWLGIEPLTTWVELELGTYSDNTVRKRPDLIFEYEDELWIIEVKQHGCAIDEVCQGAVTQLRSYLERINALGWWKSKSKHIAVFWSRNPSDIEGKDLPFDVEESYLWPGSR